MRRNRLMSKIVGGVLALGMVVGIGLATGSTANAAERPSDRGRGGFNYRDAGRDYGPRDGEGRDWNRDRDGRRVWHHGRWVYIGRVFHRDGDRWHTDGGRDRR